MYNLSNLEPKFKSYLLAENISLVSLRNYLSDIRHFFGWLGSKLSLEHNSIENNIASISTKLVDQYKNEHKEVNLPVKTINRRLSALRKFFAFCKDLGLTNENPAKAVSNLSLTKAKLPNVPKFNTEDQLAEVEEFSVSSESKPGGKFDLIKGFHLKLFSLIISATLLGLIIYQNVFKKQARQQFLTTSEVTVGTRFLAFKGKLTDNLSNPITTKTDVVFNLYNSATDGKILYTTACIGKNYAITPDVEGNFKILLGSDCGGNQISNSIFVENPDVFLGIIIANDPELSPRQQIANVGYAVNAEALGGLAPGSGTSAIPFIDSSGSLLITAPSPLLKSTSGTFALSGQALTITTSIGSSGNISLSPDAGGNTLITSGNLGIGNFTPTAALDVEGSASLSGNLTFRGISNGINQLGGGSLIFQTSDFGDEALIPRMSIINSGNIGIGTLIPQAKLDVAGSVRFYDQSPIVGSTTLTIRAGTGQISNALLQWQNSSGSTLGLIDANGSLGVGTTNIKSKFHVSDNQISGAVATIENTAANNTSGHTGLQIKLGSNSSATNPNSNDRFVSFLRGDSTLLGRIIGNGSGGVTYSTTGSDFAEYFSKDIAENFAEGQIVSIVSGSEKVTKTKKAYDSGVVGIVSSHPGFVGGEDGPNKVLLALVGQAPVRISKSSSEIKRGDFLTSSQEEGLAMKAEKAGMTMGKALEDWDTQNPKETILAYVNVNWYDPSIHFGSSGDVEIKADSANSVYNGNLENNYQSILNDQIEKLTNRIDQLAQQISDNQQVISENLSSQISNFQSLISNNISVREKITSPVIETQDIVATGTAQINTISTNEIKPQDQDLTLNLENNQQSTINNSLSDKGPLARLIIKGLEGKTAAVIDAAGNASFAGTLTSTQIITDRAQITQIESKDATVSGLLSANEASIAGTLIADKIQSANIKALEESVKSAQKSAESVSLGINETQKLLSDIKNEPLPDANYYQKIDNNQQLTINNLTATGNSNLYNLAVTGSSTIGNLLIENNSILSLAWDLKLSALSTIKLFDDAVVIAKDGSITSKGALIAQGGIKTNEIKSLNEQEPVTIKQLAINNLTIGDKYLEATSSSSIITAAENFNRNGIFAPAIETKTATAGNGLIDQNTSEVIVYNSNIKESSLIYITPTSQSPTSGLTVVKKETCTNSTISNDLQPISTSCKPYFKVALASPAPTPTFFNWLIIN